MSGNGDGRTVTYADGLDASRAAEVIVELTWGPGRRGSGYRITTTAVVTAAHVVKRAAYITVRFDADTPGEWTADARVRFADPVADLAVLTIERTDAVPPVRYGKLRKADAVVACTGLGFPRFKRRDDGASTYRDLLHLVGSAPVLSNQRSGTLEITVSTPPERDPDPARSAWEGMSGAPVFAAGRLIAVVTGNHAPEGVGRLEATRLDALYDRGPVQLRQALGLPDSVLDLVDVHPVPAQSFELMAHRADVASIAPEQLLGRDAELDELTEFCSGSESYVWWQAGPWSGKTALASTFAANPPDGVRVASFFVTARLAAQADAAAFATSMIRQLAAIAEIPTPPHTASNLLPYLMDQAAERCAQRGERLLVLVDGLDEDRGSKPSIASLLPARPSANLRVLVMSRPHPGLPGDVRGDHPLRTCRVRRLERSRHARDHELNAREELKDLISSGSDGYEVVALIAASGGGLTAADLADLSGRRLHDIRWHIESVFGRSLTMRTPRSGAVYLFAHETLRDIADQTLAPELPAYHARLAAWANRYSARGWPDDTPDYLLEPYTRRLAQIGATERLAAVAADARRHDLMLRRTRSDHAALSEVADAWERVVGSDDLAAGVLLAAERQRLLSRTHNVPKRLTGVWARLGYFAHAAELARYIKGKELVDYGRALVESGRFALAEEIARRVDDDAALVLWTALLESRAGTEEYADVRSAALEFMAGLDGVHMDFRYFRPLLEALARIDPTAVATVASYLEGRIAAIHDETGEFELWRMPVVALYAPQRVETRLRKVVRRLAGPDAHDRSQLAIGLAIAVAGTDLASDAEAVSVVLDAAAHRIRGLAWMLPSEFGEYLLLAGAVLTLDAEAGEELAALVFEAAAEFNWRDAMPEWERLVATAVRALGVTAATSLVLADAVPQAARASACAVLLREGHFSDPYEARELADRGEQAARESDAAAWSLAELAAGIVRRDRDRAGELAGASEDAAHSEYHQDDVESVGPDLMRALIRLGRPRDAETLRDIDRSLLPEIAVQYARSSPADAERLVNQILSDGREPSSTASRRSGLDRRAPIHPEDLAHMSTALAAIRPAQSRELAERAAARAWERDVDENRFGALLRVAGRLPASRRDLALRMIAAASDMIETGAVEPARQTQVVAALMNVDLAAARRLYEQAELPDDPDYTDALLGICAVFDPDRAADISQRLLADADAPWRVRYVADGLVGHCDAPGHPALRPLARRAAWMCLGDEDWSEVLPALAVLEPAAIDAVLDRIRGQ